MMTNIMTSIMNAMTTCNAYCVKAVISPSTTALSSTAALFISTAPIQYIASVSPLMQTVITGIITPIALLVKS